MARNLPRLLCEVCLVSDINQRMIAEKFLGMASVLGRMLRGFLNGLAAHLEPHGEGWLILSDLAEHLGLRSREALLSWISAAGLTVIDRTDIRPQHPRASDPSDPLHAARSAELTSLWRLAAA